ncbi:crotonase/enoyl-CoA hydratase family protein [Amycolatopsis rhizosphaerae]|uniref:Crotonase/enoyl-CoA hydratase family protein n=1 Tax=Amycolatopsis rhizosphaerae TaxID=2053003 RepID=A0A558CRI5_9PSEU|nr:crotonase/enoyl-CoA hydratase family protein [Amycolatopsis rhizosphaerae]
MSTPKPSKHGLARARAQLRGLGQLARAVAANPELRREVIRGLLHRAGPAAPAASAESVAPAAQAGPAHTPPAGLAAFSSTARASRPVPATVEQTVAFLTEPARFPEWMTLHSGWRGEPPERAEAGLRFTQQAKIMGIPADLRWTVAEAGEDGLELRGTGPMGLTFGFWLTVRPHSGGAEVFFDAGLDGQPVKGPMGASVVRSLSEELDASLAKLADVLGRNAHTRPRRKPVLHRASGRTLDPATPVLVGAGQFVQREPGTLDPVALSVKALRRAAEDSGAGESLLAAADAVYSVASASWTYRDQSALVAREVGARPKETVQSSRFGGDGAQLLINAAAEAIASGDAEVVLVTGAEAGASLAAAQKRGARPDWPVQDDSVAPTRVLGIDKVANNPAEAGAGLGAPIYMYALIESAVRASLGRDPAAHQRAIGELWSRFSSVASANRHAWQPTALSAEEIARPSADNRMVSAPYTKLLCANLQVDLASGLILCSVAAAEAAGVPQDKWVFPHAGASGHDEWFVSERASLAASPAIRAIGRAALGHAGVSIEDVEEVDLYSCFPSAVQIAARELGLPTDDPARPLTVTGGLTFAGGPGNNYGSHAVAVLVQRLRDEPGAFGLSTSLGWYATKHSIGVYSATPPQRPFRHLQPIVENPPSRPVRTDHAGPGVLEAYTVPYSRDGEPEAAVLSVLTPDGARVLLRSTQPEILEALTGADDPVRRPVEVAADGAVTFTGTDRRSLPAPPPAPVLVERRGPVTVITLNRPEVRNAVNLAMAEALERAIDAFEADPDAQVAVLTGAGGAFCSGMDLKGAARGEFPMTEKRGPLGLAAKPPVKPLIAAVEGHALAGGCELALVADLIVAAEDAQFGIPEPKRGLAAAAGGVLRLRERLPRNVAMELALTGDPMPAARLAELGLINALAPAGKVLDAALDLAGRIAVNAPVSVRVSKRIVDEAVDWTTEEAFRRQGDIASAAVLSEDATEGVLAFTEKRPPVWKGR